MSAYLVSSFFLLALAAPVAARLVPDERAPVAVLAPAGNGGAGAIAVAAAAGGRVIAATGGSLVVARSDAPGFVGRLYRAGALLVMTAGSSPCGASQQAESL